MDAVSQLSPEQLAAEEERLTLLLGPMAGLAPSAPRAQGFIRVPEAERLSKVRIALGTQPPPWQHCYDTYSLVYFLSRVTHRQLVEQALQEGKFVPKEVLEEYPDLPSAKVQSPEKSLEMAQLSLF
jgi:hypothetical protein